MTSGARASGTCTKKIDLQPSSSVKMPPTPGPERRAEDAGGDPDARRASAAARRLGQKVKSGDDDERRTDGLNAARGDEHLERGCQPACQRRSGKEHCARKECSAWQAPSQQRSRHGDEREHEVEGREHPGNRRDPDVEAPENLGERKRDDGGVRQREPDGKTEQPRAHAASLW